MNWTLHFKLFKAIVFLLMGFFLLLYGASYFELKKAWLTILIVLWFLFGILRLFEWFAEIKALKRKKVPDDNFD